MESVITNFDRNFTDVIQQARQLDLTALGQIYDYFFSKLYRYCCFRLGSSDIADEACSEIFSLLLETLHLKPDSIDDLETWLFDTASAVVDSILMAQPELISTNSLIQNDQAKPKDDIAWLENLVRSSLNRLVPEQQHLLALRFAGPCSTEETARLMDRNIPEVRSLQSDALSILRRFLEEGA
jgi:RNA polymerase sigma-70 factor (ECF subfamily)